ncbi:MAG: HNH endonuclease [Nitrospinae bacterium]|nr:HNH endonuclease [Nitrospinota bacterium]
MIERLKVLVLNNTFEPLHFTPARRAVSMLLAERAEQIESDGVVLRSFSGQMACPTVIRLKRHVRIPNWGMVAFSKKNILRRDRRTCQYCGQTEEDMTMDHIVPRSLGGGISWLNVVAACKKCNLKKGNRLIGDTGMRLIRKPYVPKFITFSNHPPTVPESFIKSWQKYLAAYVKDAI